MKITVKKLKQLFREAAGYGPGKFHAGDVVVSNVNAQGMTKGERYVVTDMSVRHTPFGGFTTYLVKPEAGGPELRIGNGHLVLDFVEVGQSPEELPSPLPDRARAARHLPRRGAR